MRIFNRPIDVPPHTRVLESRWHLSPRASSLLAILFSLVVWEGWQGFRVFHHPWGDLKGATYTDHFSHMNAARVFPLIGTSIWRYSYNDMFRHLTATESKHLPTDVVAGASPTGGMFAVPGWDATKPLISSWSNNPRNYPPGDMLLVAPVAAAYAHTRLSFTTANRLLLMLFLLYAHVALWLIFLTAFEAMATCAPSADRRLFWITAITLAVIYVEVIHWTLEGFYDAAALAPLVLCGRLLRQRRGLLAVAAFCVAAFIHFRAYFFAPWLVYGFVLVVRNREWSRWRFGSVGLILIAATLGAISLRIFFILWPSLRSTHVHGPGSSAGFSGLLMAIFFVVAALIAFTLYRSGAWFDLAVLGWLAVMIMCVRERYPWHTVVAVLPWLSAPWFLLDPERMRRILIARLALLVASVCLVFGFEPLAVWNLWPA